MLETLDISDDEYYDPKFYKYASNEIVKSNYPLIGEVISVFNSIENSLNDDLIELINPEIDSVGWIIISDMPFSVKFILWKKLVSFFISQIDQIELKEKYTSELKELSNSIQEAATLRNKIAHADWDNINEKLFAKTKTKFTKDNNVEHNFLKIDIDEFDKIITRMSDTDCFLAEFGKRLTSLL